jgi:hypothetical protein
MMFRDYEPTFPKQLAEDVEAYVKQLWIECRAKLEAKFGPAVLDAWQGNETLASTYFRQALSSGPFAYGGDPSYGLITFPRPDQMRIENAMGIFIYQKTPEGSWVLNGARDDSHESTS